MTTKGHKYDSQAKNKNKNVDIKFSAHDAFWNNLYSQTCFSDHLY
jgi:hypothetical protein